MSVDDRHYCRFCGKMYHSCDYCTKNSFLFYREQCDTKEHFELYQIIYAYLTKEISKEEASKKINELNYNLNDSTGESRDALIELGLIVEKDVELFIGEENLKSFEELNIKEENNELHTDDISYSNKTTYQKKKKKK